MQATCLSPSTSSRPSSTVQATMLLCGSWILTLATFHFFSDGHCHRDSCLLMPQNLPCSAHLCSPASDALSLSTLQHSHWHLCDHSLCLDDAAFFHRTF